MKKSFLGIGVCIIFGLTLSAYASPGGTSGESYGREVAHLPRHFTSERIRYQAGIRITGLRGNFTSVVIPSMIGNRNVTQIGDRAFFEKNLSTVVISEGITIIGKQAFANSGISQVSIPPTVREIKESAFENNALTRVDIPEGVISISERGFANNALTEISLPSTFDYIFPSVFENNALTRVDIPEKVSWISSRAFANNKISEVSIPPTVRSIGGSAFENNALTRVTFLGPIYRIYSRAFANNNLTSVILPQFTQYSGTLTDTPERTNSRLAIDAFADNDLARPFVIPATLRELSTGSIIGLIEGQGTNRSVTVVVGSEIEWRDRRTFRIAVRNEIDIPSYMFGIPVTKIAAGYVRDSSIEGNRPRTGFYAGTTGQYNRIRLGTLVLPETLREIEPDAFAFCTIGNVVAPNQAVRVLWDNYYAAQRDLDIVTAWRAASPVDRLEMNMEVLMDAQRRLAALGPQWRR